MNTVLRYLRKLVAVENSRSVEDRELLRRFVQHRDEAAFAALVERHGPLVLGACRRVLRNEQDAEDVLQATFLVLVRKAGSIRRRESVGSWLYGVAHRLAPKARVQAARRRAGEKQAAEQIGSPAADPLTMEESQRLLDEELQRLPEKYRAPILLCCLEGKSRDEAARELGWAEGAVKIRLERGRELLRRRLARRGLALSTALFATVLATDASAAALPVRLVANLVEVGMKFAAGQSLTGLVPASVQTLASGALQAMATAKWKAVAVALLLVGVFGVGAGAFTYTKLSRNNETPPGLPGKEFVLVEPTTDPLPQLSAAEEPWPDFLLPALEEKSDLKQAGRTFAGVIRSVEADGRSLTVRAQERDTTYAVSPEVSVLIDGKRARLDDLRAPYRVKITLTQDDRQILGVVAAGPVVSCPLQTVDAERHTITVWWRQGDVGKSPSPRTFNVAREAIILIEGEPATLADIRGDAEVGLQLSVDGKTVIGIEMKPR